MFAEGNVRRISVSIINPTKYYALNFEHNNVS